MQRKFLQRFGPDNQSIKLEVNTMMSLLDQFATEEIDEHRETTKNDEDLNGNFSGPRNSNERQA